MPVQRDWISLALPLCLCLPSAGALHHPFLLKVRDNSLPASFEGAARERLHTCTLPCQGRKMQREGRGRRETRQKEKAIQSGGHPGPHGLTFSKGFFKRAAKRLKEVLFS